MHPVTRLHFATLAALAICPAGAIAASAPHVGTWKMNPAESLNMADPGGSQTTVIRRHDTVLDYTWTGISADGKTDTFSFSGPVDGKEKLLPGGDGLRGAMVRTPEGVIEGKLKFKDGSSEDKYCILSAPKKLTCFATFIDAAGKQSLYKEVFDKM
jgi:hypothetical protein